MEKAKAIALKGALLVYNLLALVIPIQERIIAALYWAVDTEKKLLQALKGIILDLIGPPPMPPSR